MANQLPALDCTDCATRTSWPRWRKIADRRYLPLCWRCFSASTLISTLARRSAVV